MCGNCTMNRRRFLMLSAVGATAATAGCDKVDLVSDEQVREMGVAAWRDISARVPASTNREAAGILDEVADRVLAAAGESAAHWQVRLFAGTEINAFALPGNHIGVFEGMLRVTRNPDQLAAIVGHEIGHVMAEHSQERMSAAVAKEHGLNFLFRLLQIGEVEFAAEIAAALGLGLEYGVLLPYSRRQELEADEYGIGVMGAAGYSPEEAIALWRNMEAAVPGRAPEFLATHPAPQSRIEQIEQIIADT